MKKTKKYGFKKKTFPCKPILFTLKHFSISLYFLGGSHHIYILSHRYDDDDDDNVTILVGHPSISGLIDIIEDAVASDQVEQKKIRK